MSIMYPVCCVFMIVVQLETIIRHPNPFVAKKARHEDPTASVVLSVWNVVTEQTNEFRRMELRK